MTRTLRRSLIIGAIAAITCASLYACRTIPSPYTNSPQLRDGKFSNVVPREPSGLGRQLAIGWRMLTEKPDTTVPQKPIPVTRLTPADLADAPDASLFRIGHAALLLKLKGEFWLTDPMFSERASPVQWAGPKRFHPTPIAIGELPPIKGVIISHDHYDHLDHDSIVQLAPKVEVFVTPLGVGDRLIAWGVPATKVRQLDWWQETTVQGVRLVAAPAQHFSGRTLADANSTLWASWIIIAGDLKLFFGSDTGYHANFQTIGERYGPFDFTMLETGAYDAQWPDVHMQPEQVMKAHQELKGRWLIPVHNSTFDLAFHPWQEPLERIDALAKKDGVKIATPGMGERFSLAAPQPGKRWWTEL